MFFTAGCKKHRQCRNNKNDCSPVVDLKFNGNTQDLSYVKNKVIVHGAPTPSTDRFGNAKGALAFNGSTDYLELPHVKAYTGTSLIVTAWVYPTDFKYYDNGIKPMKDYSGIFNKWDNNTRKGVSTYATDRQSRVNGNFANKDFYDFGTEPGSFLSLNHWQHIAYKICGGTVTLYLNGQQVAEKKYGNSTGMLTVTAPIEIGRTQWYPSNARTLSYFTGSMDDVQVYYNCCDLKIQELYQSKP